MSAATVFEDAQSCDERSLYMAFEDSQRVLLAGVGDLAAGTVIFRDVPESRFFQVRKDLRFGVDSRL